MEGGEGRKKIEIPPYAVLADFDVARVSNGGTTTAGASGTEPFMAPEVANRDEISPTADMFSIGVTMVCVLMPEIWDARMPKSTTMVLKLFNRDHDCSALSKHLLKEPLPSTEALTEASVSVVEAIEREQLCDVVSQLLNADPTKRPGASNVLDHPFFEKIQLSSNCTNYSATAPGRWGVPPVHRRPRGRAGFRRRDQLGADSLQRSSRTVPLHDWRAEKRASPGGPRHS